MLPEPLTVTPAGARAAAGAIRQMEAAAAARLGPGRLGHGSPGLLGARCHPGEVGASAGTAGRW